jgi:hypothetical protein
MVIASGKARYCRKNLKIVRHIFVTFSPSIPYSTVFTEPRRAQIKYFYTGSWTRKRHYSHTHTHTHRRTRRRYNMALFKSS